MFTTREQFWAFVFLLFCVGTLGMAPAACVVMLGKSLDTATLATLDKTVSSLASVLGGAAALLFRQTTMRATRRRIDRKGAVK